MVEIVFDWLRVVCMDRNFVRLAHLHLLTMIFFKKSVIVRKRSWWTVPWIGSCQLECDMLLVVRGVCGHAEGAVLPLVHWRPVLPAHDQRADSNAVLLQHGTSLGTPLPALPRWQDKWVIATIRVVKTRLYFVCFSTIIQGPAVKPEDL